VKSNCGNLVWRCLAHASLVPILIRVRAGLMSAVRVPIVECVQL
jgi:hypothetical protein